MKHKENVHSVRTISVAVISLCSIFLFVLLTISGCTRQEEPKKVSLYARGDSDQHKPDQVKPNTLWFGFDLRLGPKEEVRIYTTFLQYLERKTGKRFRIRFTEKYEDTVDNLGKGATHFASLGTLNYVIGAGKYGIRYLVSGVNKEGDPTYHSAIVTGKESTVQNLQDLQGRCFAFGSRRSTQGHLIPRKMLENAGVTIEDLGKAMYTGSHINAVKAVLNGECAAAGIQDALASRLVSEGKVRIIKVSLPYPSSLIAYNRSVDSEIVASVKEALLAFEPGGRDQSMLVDWDKTDMPMGFTRINELELDRVKALAQQYGILAP